MYTQVNQYHVLLEVEPSFRLDPSNLNQIYIQANASAGTNGPGASTSFAASGSASAGSNALTGTTLYSPAANTLSPPSNSLSGKTASTGVNSAGSTSSNSFNLIPLNSFCHFQKTTEPLSINHQAQFPAITASFNLSPNPSLAEAISLVDKTQKD